MITRYYSSLMLIYSFSFLSSLQRSLVLYLTCILSTCCLFCQRKFVKERDSKGSSISASAIMLRVCFFFLMIYLLHSETKSNRLLFTKSKRVHFSQTKQTSIFSSRGPLLCFLLINKALFYSFVLML